MSILSGITRPGHAPLTNPAQHGSGGFMNRCKVAVQGPDGKIKQETPWVWNVANTFGLASLASMVGSGGAVTASSLVSAMRIGTGTTAATSTDASMSASTQLIVITGASLTKTNLGNRTVEFQGTFSSTGGTMTISEVALYCNSTADSQLLAHSILGTNSVNRGASDQILVSYDVVLTTSSTGL